MDMLFVGIISHAVVQIKILKDELTKLGDYAGESSSGTKESDMLTTNATSQCIRNHIIIIR